MQNWISFVSFHLCNLGSILSFFFFLSVPSTQKDIAQTRTESFVHHECITFLFCTWVEIYFSQTDWRPWGRVSPARLKWEPRRRSFMGLNKMDGRFSIMLAPVFTSKPLKGVESKHSVCHFTKLVGFVMYRGSHFWDNWISILYCGYVK